MLLREDGQILPGLAVLLAVTLALGVLFFQVGKASILRSDAQNAADAAALAGAQEIQRQLEAQYALSGLHRPDRDQRAARRRQDAGVRAPEPRRADQAGPQPAGGRREGVGGQRGRAGRRRGPREQEDFQASAKARAQVQLGAFSVGDPGGSPVPRAGRRARRRDPEGDGRRVGRRSRGRSAPEPRDCPDVIALGLLLVSKGFQVWQNAHPALGGDAGHEDKPQSNHHACNDMGALDVNYGRSGDNVPEEMAAVEPAARPARTSWATARSGRRRGTTTTSTSTSAARAAPSTWAARRGLRLRRAARPHRAGDQARRLGEAGRHARRSRRRVRDDAARSADRPTSRSCG